MLASYINEHLGGRDGVLFTNITNQGIRSLLAGDGTPLRLLVSQTRTLCCLNSSTCVMANDWSLHCLSLFFSSLFLEIKLLSHLTESTEIPPYMMKCPSNGLCSRLPADCIDCATNFSCTYGKPATFDCTVKPSVTCIVSIAVYLFQLHGV